MTQTVDRPNPPKYKETKIWFCSPAHLDPIDDSFLTMIMTRKKMTMKMKMRTRIMYLVQLEVENRESRKL